jgi:addiction module HigA family antidote
MNKLDPVTPGEILLEEFLKPMGLSQYRLAREIGVPAQRISEIVRGKRSITADTDLRLCRFFGLSNGYWLRAQAAYDTELAERTLSPILKKIKPYAEYKKPGSDPVFFFPLRLVCATTITCRDKPESCCQASRFISSSAETTGKTVSFPTATFSSTSNGWRKTA